MNEAIIAIVFFIGLIFGSFYNVVAYRLANDLSIASPGRSFCPNCNRQLKWYENIPLLSFIFLNGKCKGCKSKISIVYPLVELATAFLFAYFYIVFGLSREFLIAIILSSVLVIVAVTDFKYLIIPNEVTIVSSILVLIVKLSVSFKSFLYSLLAGALSFIIMFIIMKISNLIFKKESMGLGDVKLMFLIGASTGLLGSIISIFLAAFLAFPLACYKLISDKDDVVAFGPFLVLAALIIYRFNLVNVLISIFQ